MSKHFSWEELKRERGSSPEMRRAYAATRRRIDLAEQLYALRTAQDLTQAELGRRAGMSQGAIARVEAAAVEPKMETLARLSEALGGRLVVRIEVGSAA